MSEYFFDTDEQQGIVVLAEFRARDIRNALAGYSTQRWDIDTSIEIPSYEAESIHEKNPNKFVIRGPVQINDRNHYVVAVLAPKEKFTDQSLVREHASNVLGFFKNATGMSISPVNTSLENLLRILQS